jgi:hypothetical protein
MKMGRNTDPAVVKASARTDVTNQWKEDMAEFRRRLAKQCEGRIEESLWTDLWEETVKVVHLSPLFEEIKIQIPCGNCDHEPLTMTGAEIETVLLKREKFRSDMIAFAKNVIDTYSDKFCKKTLERFFAGVEGVIHLSPNLSEVKIQYGAVGSGDTPPVELKGNQIEAELQRIKSRPQRRHGRRSQGNRRENEDFNNLVEEAREKIMDDTAGAGPNAKIALNGHGVINFCKMKPDFIEKQIVEWLENVRKHLVKEMIEGEDILERMRAKYAKETPDDSNRLAMVALEVAIENMMKNQEYLLKLTNVQ